MYLLEVLVRMRRGTSTCSLAKIARKNWKDDQVGAAMAWRPRRLGVEICPTVAVRAVGPSRATVTVSLLAKACC